MSRMIRSAFVIARRDFTATVLSKAFIFFLIGPMLPILMAGVFIGIGTSAERQAQRPVVAVLAAPDQFENLSKARERLAQAIGDGGVPLLQRFDVDPDHAVQESTLLQSKDPPVLAVLSMAGERATLTGAVGKDDETGRRLQLLLEQAHSRPDGPAPALQIHEQKVSSGKLSAGRSKTAGVGQGVLFFLTMLLATMLLSQVIEEKSNKIIEVIAAAVPMEAMFVGKLFAMLAASLVGIVVWASVGALMIQSLTAQGLGDLPTPAVGWPAFLAFTAIYFAMNYLILGALFLGIGAQASTPREVQTLSMPVTILQVMIFGFASASVGQDAGAIGLAAAIFPLSSPMVMIGRAAEQPELWPHLLALGWQILWVGVMLKVGARFFRSRVLKSGPGQPLFRRSRA